MRRLILLLSACFVFPVSAEEPPVTPGTRSIIQFSESPLQSSDPEQIRHRLMASEQPGAYDVSKESYEILLPKIGTTANPTACSSGSAPGTPQRSRRSGNPSWRSIA